MFTQLGTNEVISDKGFSVKRTERFELKYSQGSKFIAIEVEPGDGLAIYKQSIKNWNNGEQVLQEDIPLILQRVSEALDFLLAKYTIV